MDDRPSPSRPLDAPVTRWLLRLRRLARSVLVVTELARLGAGVGLVLIASGWVDFALRLPSWLRVALLIVGVWAVARAVLRRVLPAFGFAPGTADLALCAAGLARQGELLATAAEFEHSRTEDPLTQILERGVAQRGQALLAQLPSPRRLVRCRAMLSAGAWFAAAVALVAILSVSFPVHAPIAAARLLTPWRDVSWPRRVDIVDVTDRAVVAIGRAVPIRAGVVRTDRGAGKTPVSASYRVITEGGSTPLMSVRLSAQPKALELESGDLAELYERLIEPAVPQNATRAELEYWLTAVDDRTERVRLILVEPPRVTGASIIVAGPGYAPSDALVEAGYFVGSRPLGAGLDERAVVAPILAGSRAELTIELNKPLPIPAGVEERAAWLTAALGVQAIGDDAETRLEPERLVLAATLQDSVRLPISVRDEFGLSNREEPVYSLQVMPDREPSASITEPSRDESVLASAVIDTQAQGADDVGLESLSLEQVRARPLEGSVGSAPEPTGDWVSIERWAQDHRDARTHSLATRLDLAEFALAPGDELWLSAVARDTYAFDGRSHDPVRSGVRRLRIISPDELVDEIRRELNGVRDLAVRLDEQQRDLIDQLNARAAAQADAGAQREITARAELAASTLARLAERVATNRLDDASLAGVLGDAQNAAAAAQEASRSAAERLDEAARTGADESRRAERREQQERVRDELAQIAEMLDQGQDSWLVRRAIEQLLAEQRGVTQQTQEIAQQTAGQSAEQLSDLQRNQLERLAERQQQLAEQAQRTIEQLQDRAQSMQDPAQSSAMQSAAQRAMTERVEQSMQQASEQIQQNQTSQAGAQQQQAEQTLREMLDDLDDAQRQRDEQLRRLLASLIESIRGLVTTQEREISRLTAAMPTGAFAGLDAGMIDLVRSTTVVAAEVPGGDPELAALRTSLDRAADAQSRAASGLRAETVDAEGVDVQERKSLTNLRDALSEAERLEKEVADRDAQRQREELRRAYAEALELQSVVLADTRPYLGREPNRRDRATLRRLGAEQRSILNRVSQLRSDISDIGQTIVLDYAHTRLEQVTEQAAALLEGASADAQVGVRQQTAVRLLQSIVEALKDPDPDEDPFSEGEQGGGGGGGQGQGEPEPLVPDMAELILLRMLQEEVNDLTRAAEAAPGAIAEAGELQQELAERGQSLLEKLTAPPQPQIPRAPESDGGGP